MQIAIGNRMMAPAASWPERCRLAKEAGFDGVEVWIGTDDLTMETTDDEVRRLGEGLASAGLSTSSIASTMGWDNPIGSADPAVRARALAIARRQIECARLLGTDAILVVTGRGSREVDQLDGLARIVSAFKELAPYAAEHGVRIGVETCPGLSKNLMTPYECVGFVRDVGSDAVGIYLDTANVMLSGYPEHFVRALREKLVRIHFKDTKTTPEGRRTSTWPGDGEVEFAGVVAACREVGYDSWAIMEFGSARSLEEGLARMRAAAESTRRVLANAG